MNTAESICGDIEEANLIDLRGSAEGPAYAPEKGTARCKKLERKIIHMKESDQYPGINSHKASVLSRASMTVRYMCAAWYKGQRPALRP